MIRAVVTGLAVFFAVMLALLGLAIAQSAFAKAIGSPLGDVIFWFAASGCILLVFIAARRFTRKTR